MDDDMNRRIANAATKRAEIETAQKEAIDHKASQNAARVSNSSQKIAKIANLETQRTTKYLWAVEDHLKDIFSSKEARRLRLASAFSMSEGTINRPGYMHHYSGESPSSYVRPTAIPSPLTDKIKSRFLIIKLNSKEGIAVSYEPSDACEDYEDLSQYNYVVNNIHHGGPKLVSSPLFITMDGWHSSGAQKFDELDDLINHLKDTIAEKIHENREKFKQRLTARVLKVAAIGSAVAAFMWASGAFGQEAEPANDFMPPQPDEPAAHLIMDDPK